MLQNRKRNQNQNAQIHPVILYSMIALSAAVIVAGCIWIINHLRTHETQPTPLRTAETLTRETAVQTETDIETAQAFTTVTAEEITSPPDTASSISQPDLVTLETVHTELVQETIPVQNQQTTPAVSEQPQTTAPEQPTSAVIPDCSNQNCNHAEVQLRNAGYTVERTYEFSETVPEDIVIRTEPGAGKPASPGEKISIVISQGTEPIITVVPDLVGRHITDCEEVLLSDHLRYEVVETAASEPEGIIIMQSIPPGEPVDESQVLELTVSKGESLAGTVAYTLEIPADAAGCFRIRLYDEYAVHIADSGYGSAADGSLTLTVDGVGMQKVFVVLENSDNGQNQEIGTYNFYYADGTFAAISENTAQAFEGVGAFPAETFPNTETTSE